VSGGRGLLEAASAVVVAFDLDVPFRQDAEEAQGVDESATTWGHAACLV
jgi:NAD(P)H-dependent FMN reductase